MDDRVELAGNNCMKPTDYIKSDVNILLLGESGVGKSTFINSFANYLHHRTLKEALQSKLHCLISTVFTVTDENFEDKTITFGNDNNEDRSIGNSSTQYPRAYVFPLKDEDFKIRLIDTPGIGDSRGIEQDERNFENILAYLSLFPELHAICFLLKPNVSVINAYFKFCIKHLISRLEVSAARNIVFIFTNGRGSFYRPGSTSKLLEIILEEIKSTPPHVEIPFSKENKFCFDNEVFNYLVAVRKGVQFGDAEKEAYNISWERSVESVRRLLKYIAGDGMSSTGLTPHRIQNTCSVNNVRRLVLDLTRPLADITDLIQDNLCVLNNRKKIIQNENLSIAELEKSLYVPVINLKQTSLPDPVVVCTSNKCTEICVVSGLKKYHYTQKCCKNCKTANVERNLIGSPSLLECEAFGPDKQCLKCGCDFSCHMQVFYETALHEDTVVDESIKKELKSKEDEMEARYRAILGLMGRISEFEGERDEIKKAIAKFVLFLTNNSISSYNDAFKDYVDYLIEREDSLGPQRNQGVIARYRYLKKQHEEEKKLLDSVKAEGAAESCPESIDPKEIQELIESLYRLKHTGKKIKELHAKQQKVTQTLHTNTMEYCHPEGVERDGAKKKKKNKATKQQEKKLTDKLGKLSLEEMEKSGEMEEMLREYLRKNLAEGSTGAKVKPLNVKGKDNNKSKGEGKSGSDESEKKTNNVEKKGKDGENKKKNFTQIKNNLEKAEAEEVNKDGQKKKGKKNNPQQNIQAQNIHPQNVQSQHVPYNQNYHPHQLVPPQPHMMGPQQYPMQQNPFPVQQNYYPMGNQYVGQPAFIPPQQQNVQYPPPGNYSNPPFEASASGGGDSGRFGGRGGKQNQRGKPRGNFNQSREDRSEHFKKNPQNKFKRTPARRSQNTGDCSDSDASLSRHGSTSNLSQASSSDYRRRDHHSQRGGTRNSKENNDGEKLDYQKMMKFLEEQKKVIQGVHKKNPTGGDKKRKSETIIMMIRKDE